VPWQHFDRLAADYASARPPYPTVIFDLLSAEGVIGPGLRVLEIGAGAGLATKGLVAAGSHVTALEPGPALCSLLEETVPGVPVVPSRLEEAELPPATFDSVVAATSMHWVGTTSPSCTCSGGPDSLDAAGRGLHCSQQGETTSCVRTGVRVGWLPCQRSGSTPLPRIWI